MPPLYTDAEAVRASVCQQVLVLLPVDDADLDLLIERAEADIDRLLDFDLERDATTGRKLDPEALTTAQAAALAEAVAMQVEFRALVTEEELVGDDTIQEAGNIRLGPSPRPPGPKAAESLAGMGFAWRSGLAKTSEDAAEA